MRASILLRETAKRLEAVTPDARFEAKELVCGVLGCSEMQLRRDDPELSADQRQQLEEWVLARLDGYPLQYLLGNWEFYGLPFIVGPGVLIPRADTETLVETGLSFLKDRPAPRVLDLCSGTGCVAMALAANLSKEATVYALEKEPKAFSYLEQNQKALQSAVQLLLDDALCPSFSEGAFDLITSNPPYLSEEDRKTLQREVSFEPESALFDGGDGLYFYRALTKIWKDRLKPGGMLAYEIGQGQEEAVRQELLQNGFVRIRLVNDLAGIVRVVCGEKE